MSNGTDSYGEWLNTELKLFETYQNHKETMAWTATALFLAGGAAFVSSVPDFAIASQWLASLWILLATLALFVFLHMQFKKRWDGADTQEGIRCGLARLYLKAEADKLNFEPSKEGPAPGLPKFVTDEIAEIQLRKPRRIGCKDLRWRSELSSYFLVPRDGCHALYGVECVYLQGTEDERIGESDNVVVKAGRSGSCSAQRPISSHQYALRKTSREN